MDYCYKYFNYVSILAIFTDQGKPYLDVKNADISKHLLLKKKKRKKNSSNIFCTERTLERKTIFTQHFEIFPGLLDISERVDTLNKMSECPRYF